MTDNTTPRKKYKIVFRRGRTLTKLALLGVIVLSTVALIAIHNATASNQERLENSRGQAIDEELRQNQIQDNLDNLGSPDSVGDIANSELGYEDPDSVILVPKN